jgi:hypothetical protein
MAEVIQAQQVAADGQSKLKIMARLPYYLPSQIIIPNGIFLTPHNQFYSQLRKMKSLNYVRFSHLRRCSEYNENLITEWSGNFFYL